MKHPNRHIKNKRISRATGQHQGRAAKHMEHPLAPVSRAWPTRAGTDRQLTFDEFTKKYQEEQ